MIVIDDIQYEGRSYKVNIQSQIGGEIVLFTKFEHFKCIAMITMLL